MKPRRAWRWLLAALGVVAAVAALIVWDAHRRADAVIERHRREADLLLSEFRSRDASRPPLEGEGVEGNAWDLYRKILPSLGKLSPAEEAALPAFNPDMDVLEAPDDHLLSGIFAARETEVEALRDALRRRTVDPGCLFELGTEVKYELLGEVMAVSKFLQERTLHLHRGGRESEALQSALLGLGFAQDVGRRGSVIGLLVRQVCEDISVWALRELLKDAAGGAGEWEIFVKALDRLDAQRPSGRDEWDSEELQTRYSLLRPFPADMIRELRSLLGWKQLFSERIFRAQVLSRLPSYFQEGRETLAVALPWERARRADEAGLRWGREGNLGIRSLLSASLFRGFKKDVRGLLGRTLLRVGAALAWYEAAEGHPAATLGDLVPSYLAALPPCPYTGTPLRYADGRLWSIGSDGKDDGGVPDEFDNDDPETEGKDVVWVVKRRK